MHNNRNDGLLVKDENPFFCFLSFLTFLSTIIHGVSQQDDEKLKGRKFYIQMGKWFEIAFTSSVQGLFLRRGGISDGKGVNKKRIFRNNGRKEIELNSSSRMRRLSWMLKSSSRLAWNLNSTEIDSSSFHVGDITRDASYNLF